MAVGVDNVGAGEVGGAAGAEAHLVIVALYDQFPRLRPPVSD